MALSLIAYPKIIFVQPAIPTNTTAGLLFYDTDDGLLYVADGSNYTGITSQIIKTKGILATATDWSTPPSNLANITDENPTSVTGTGIKTGVTDITYIDIDLGKDYRLSSIFYKVGGWVSNISSSFLAELMVKKDGGSYVDIGVNLVNNNVTSEQIITGVKSLTYENSLVRYIQIKCSHNSASVNSYLKVYDISAK